MWQLKKVPGRRQAEFTAFIAEINCSTHLITSGASCRVHHHAPVMKHTPHNPSLMSLNMVDSMAPRLTNTPYVICWGIIMVRVHEHASAAVTITANVAHVILIQSMRSCVLFTSMHAYINANTSQPSASFTPSIDQLLFTCMIRHTAHDT